MRSFTFLIFIAGLKRFACSLRSWGRNGDLLPLGQRREMRRATSLQTLLGRRSRTRPVIPNPAPSGKITVEDQGHAGSGSCVGSAVFDGHDGVGTMAAVPVRS